MNTIHTTEKTSSQAHTKATITNEISKVGVYTIVISAGIVGCWATACLVAGTISSGGPVSLVLNFVSAVIG